MPIIDWTMKPTWQQVSESRARYFYQGLPLTHSNCYYSGTTYGSGNSRGYIEYQVGMAPLDTAGYRGAYIEMYQLNDTIGHALMDSGYSGGISEGDFLWMRSTARTGRRDLVRVLKVITDGEDGGSSHPTAETILILELQVDAMGWPNPNANGYGHLTHSQGGYRFDMGSWAQSGTIELVTENLESGGTSYSVASIGRQIARFDSAGMGLGAAYSADELKWWQRTGYGGGQDWGPYIVSSYPQRIADYSGSGPMSNVDRDGNQGITYDLNNSDNHRVYEGWGINYGEGYSRGEWGLKAREMYLDGHKWPFFRSGNSSVDDVDGNNVLWEGRYATPVYGFIENPPPYMQVMWQHPGSGTYGHASRAEYHLTFSGNPADGDTVTITDDNNTTKTFEFESGGGVTGGNVSVTIGSDGASTALNLNTAIRSEGNDDAFRVYFDADADFYGGSTATSGDDKVVQVTSLYTGSTTNFAVTESSSVITATKIFDGHDGGGFRPNAQHSRSTVPGGVNHFPMHCADMVITLVK